MPYLYVNTLGMDICCIVVSVEVLSNLVCLSCALQVHSKGIKWHSKCTVMHSKCTVMPLLCPSVMRSLD